MSPYLQSALDRSKTPFGLTCTGDGEFCLTYRGQRIHKPMGRKEALALYHAQVWLAAKVTAVAACSRLMPAGNEA